MSFDFDDPLDPMSPFFQDEFIFNEDDKPKNRRNDHNDKGGYNDPYTDDDDERDD